MQELVADAKANPGKITFASGGPATSLHVAIEVLRLATKIDINYVPYGGSGPAITALMGGHVQAVWADYPTVVSQLKSGTLRALVTTSPKRLAVLPGVPIMEETGITKYEAEIFYGLVAPAKTPPQAIKNLSDMLLAAMNTPEMKSKFEQQGLFPDGTCGDEVRHLPAATSPPTTRRSPRPRASSRTDERINTHQGITNHGEANDIAQLKRHQALCQARQEGPVRRYPDVQARARSGHQAQVEG